MLPSPNFVPAPVSVPPSTTAHVRTDENHKINFLPCKFCRENFGSQRELIAHRQAHVKCTYDDCHFHASQKVVDEHIKRVHVKVKIQDLSTPEQIEKWKEDRRKRYPTTANVQLRQQAQEERLKRGEKLQDSRARFGDNQQKNHINHFDKHNNQRRDNQNIYGRNRNQNKFDRSNWKQKPERVSKVVAGEPPKLDELEVDAKSRKTHQEISKEAASTSKSIHLRKPQEFKRYSQPADDGDSSEDEKRATPRFAGTVHMKDYHSVEIAVKEQKALSILGMYGSDTEFEQSDDETRRPEPVVVTPSEIEATTNDNQAEDIDPSQAEAAEIDDEMPEELPIEHKIDPLPQLETQKPETFSRKRKFDHQQARKDVRMRPRRYGLDYSKLHKPSVNPFLEKLLQDDIRHERNVLLQCVSYIVKNNFFDAPAEAAEPDRITETNAAEIQTERAEE